MNDVVLEVALSSFAAPIWCVEEAAKSITLYLCDIVFYFFVFGFSVFNDDDRANLDGDLWLCVSTLA
jgi:hypothetical protein